MDALQNNPQSRRAPGATILEALLAIAVFGVLAAGTLTFVVSAIGGPGLPAERERAIFLADEGLAAARSIRNDGWTGLTAGAHGIAQSGGKWIFSGPSDTSL
ncbi:MAG: hypothetical protein AAB692_02200, partial [Patescibacteria group bacterium]